MDTLQEVPRETGNIQSKDDLLDLGHENSNDLSVEKRKWHSHDVLYNFSFHGEKYWREEFPPGKYIIPQEARTSTMQSEPRGKGKVYGVECLIQPCLKLYYA
eukprot:c20852_g1_i2 orf=102-407(-)